MDKRQREVKPIARTLIELYRCNERAFRRISPEFIDDDEAKTYEKEFEKLAVEFLEIFENEAKDGEKDEI